MATDEVGSFKAPSPASLPPLTRDGAYTLLPKAVKETTEDALVGPAVWVRDEHIHITTGHLPPAVRATCHTQQPRVEGLG